jgi:hypothetical protein
MKKFYEYKIVYDVEELTISVYEKEGFFVRNLKDGTNVYSETDDGKNLFFIYKNNFDKVQKIHSYEKNNSYGYSEIFCMTEYEDKDKFKKYEIQDKVKEELEKIAKERLKEIKSFINKYDELMQNGITVFAFELNNEG